MLLRLLVKSPMPLLCTLGVASILAGIYFLTLYEKSHRLTQAEMGIWYLVMSLIAWIVLTVRWRSSRKPANTEPDNPAA